MMSVASLAVFFRLVSHHGSVILGGQCVSSRFQYHLIPALLHISARSGGVDDVSGENWCFGLQIPSLCLNLIAGFFNLSNQFLCVSGAFR